MRLLAVTLLQKSKAPLICLAQQWLICELLACPSFEIKCVRLRLFLLPDDTGSESRFSEEAARRQAAVTGGAPAWREFFSESKFWCSGLPGASEGKEVIFLCGKCLPVFFSHFLLPSGAVIAGIHLLVPAQTEYGFGPNENGMKK